MRICTVLVMMCFACKSDSKPTPPPPKEPQAGKELAKELAKEPAHEIATQPRTAMAGKTTFLEFTIEVPGSASMPIKGEKATSWTFKDSKLDLQVREVSVPPSDSPPKGEALESKTTRTLKQEAGAYLVVDRKDDATGFRVEYCRDLDPKEPPSGLCCHLELKSETPIVDIDKLTTFGEQMCRSIKATNRKMPPPAGSAAGSAAK